MKPYYFKNKFEKTKSFSDTFTLNLVSATEYAEEDAAFTCQHSAFVGCREVMESISWETTS